MRGEGLTPSPSDEGALSIPGATARHGPSDEDWKRLGNLLAPHCLGGLFTVLRVDRPRGLVQRVYSSDPVAYPAGGTKQLMGTPWARHVLDDGRCFIASTRAQMEAAFADHQTLFAMGCTTALNIPVRQDGDVAFTVNLLRGGTEYSPAESLIVKSCVKRWISELFLPHPEATWKP